ncbi:MAG TPA: SRPBCC family protein [Actinomycetota bacterium]|nr:SRPBCC family protein [Actinomycetota bacterium]
MDMRMTGEAELRIEASPQDVYDLVTDVTRTGEWSPECRRCKWLNGATHAREGARFRGYNRSGIVRWSRLVEVVAADSGREFAFRTLPDLLNKDSTTWRYKLEPSERGTIVRQSYEIHRLPAFPVNLIMRTLLRHHADLRPHMRQTLERIKAIAERSTARSSR